MRYMADSVDASSSALDLMQGQSKPLSHAGAESHKLTGCLTGISLMHGAKKACCTPTQVATDASEVGL